MEQNETTALIPFADDAPTIEFTLPPREEPYTETIVIETEEKTRGSAVKFLKRFAAGFLSGITIAAAGVCAVHAAASFSPEADDIPTALLAMLSVGEIHCTAPLPETQKVSAADMPDTILHPLSPPPEEKPAREPNPLTIQSEPPYTPDIDALLARERAIPPLDGSAAAEPVVLILSTHATESYRENADTGYRTPDDTQNVILPAAVIAEYLQKAGIGVIHARTRFDEEDFTLAYYNASLEIRKQLRDHPSIRYIIDVHRDSVQDADGTYLAMETDGLAQLMFVVGTDHGGSGHSGWEDNLALAVRLHTAMETENPGLMRPVNLRSASFNQQYTSGSLILEIGSCAGSLDSAVRSAEIFARALADEILG